MIDIGGYMSDEYQCRAIRVDRTGWSRLARWYAWIIFSVFCFIVFGYRDYAVGTDTFRYFRAFEWLSTATYEQALARFAGTDIGFYLLSKVLVDAVGIRGTFVAFALYLGGAILYLVQTLNKNAVVPTLLLFLSLPIFYNLGMNVLRHGTAIAFLFIGTSYLLRRRFWVTGAWFIGAVFMHAASVIYIAACLVALKVAMPWLLGMMLVSTVLATQGFGLHHIDALVGFEIVGAVVGDRFDEYIAGIGSNRYRTGFRLDFFLYTVAPMLLIAVSTRFTLRGLINWAPRRDFLLRVYIIVSSIFFLSFQYPYSDRVGAFAWILIPLLIGIEEKNENRRGVHAITRNVGVAVIVVANIFLLVSS